LAELYLGTHNDTNIIYDPTLDLSRPLLERQRSRLTISEAICVQSILQFRCRSRVLVP
jgi:hypothetical protein